MSNTRQTIKQTVEALGIGKTSLYNYIKILNIKPIKEGRRSYLTPSNIAKIKEHITRSGGVQSTVQPTAQANDHRTTTERTGERTNEHQRHIEDIYKKQIEDLKADIAESKTELAEGREQNRVLTLELGRWEGVAKTLKEQNTKLLEKNDSIEAKVIQRADNKIDITGFFKRFFK